MNLPVLAGTVSTVLFAAGMFPMLVKAARTKDLASYSLGNLVLSNLANAVHSIYVFNLPAGPIWVLHLAYALASALMLAGWLRYRETGHEAAAGTTAAGTTAEGASAGSPAGGVSLKNPLATKGARP
ncbi:hypothetical protein AB0N33_18545 [Pseudarthrobacter oxydans]|jgi:uncharacterized protein with PQ loop repeat|uniref:hypothetical protein n=1 Tax=Pseudarthrobacter TaxID=1742993 RepID=UPI00203B5441|nr:hypothetical protein [Pseudarthrobacter sp. NCCP-2145]MDV2977193.1 hypothetical protein [Actinomycetes bacterium ARC8]GKV71519.1 hypothetical protein NCCP2145_09000 [Pseudarthrobacter sp. NCCP-2145]